MEEIIELLQKKVADLEKKIEKYYTLLKIDNELDFILNGTYLPNEDIERLLEGRN